MSNEFSIDFAIYSTSYTNIDIVNINIIYMKKFVLSSIYIAYVFWFLAINCHYCHHCMYKAATNALVWHVISRYQNQCLYAADNKKKETMFTQVLYTNKCLTGCGLTIIDKPANSTSGVALLYTICSL